MISVIGGSGFVGSCLIRNLLRNYEVENLDKKQSPFFEELTNIVNITNPNEIIFNKKVDTVILLAAEHRDDVSPISLYYDVNVEGTKNVLDAMDRHGIKKIIFTSSVAIYGLNKSNPDENHPNDPFNHYGKSKWKAELLIKEWYNNNPKEKSVTVIRPTVIFGERNRGNVFNLLKQISSGKFVMIGNGKNKKSMAYVNNVAAFIENRIRNENNEFSVFNYADKPDFSMTDLVNHVENKMKIKLFSFSVPIWLGMIGGYIFDIVAFTLNKNLAISSVRIKKFCATTQFNSEKMLTVFDPPHTLQDGLNKTLDYEFINSDNDDILFYSE